MTVPRRERRWHDRPRARRLAQLYARALDRIGVRRYRWHLVVITHDPAPVDGVGTKLYVDGRLALGINDGSAGAWVR